MLAAFIDTEDVADIRTEQIPELYAEILAERLDGTMTCYRLVGVTPYGAIYANTDLDIDGAPLLGLDLRVRFAE